MWVAVVMLCTNTLASSCEMRANTGEFFFSKASCDANGKILTMSRILKNKGYGVNFVLKIWSLKTHDNEQLQDRTLSLISLTTDGDGVVTDEELSRSERMLQIENNDKMQDQQRLMAWVAMWSTISGCRGCF
jgi:hypothetical protein